MADSTCVVDASALLAYLRDEPGAEIVEQALLRRAAISAANLAEVLTKLAEAGEDPRSTMAALRQRGFTGQALEVVPLTEDDAYWIADLRREPRTAGLSLGDRACLGLALRLRVPAVTADRSWARLKVAVRIDVVR